tara:strand:- start:145 stop:843 length:699 start_codon:yes stop_codon:yes gene_type:complete
MKVFTLSPSEFAFGFEGCKKCYYDKMVNNLKISSFFPPVFALLDICQKKYYQGKSSKSISNTLEEGVVITEESDKIIKSKILYDNKKRPFILRGKLDAYIKHKNFYTVVDFKTSSMSLDKAPMYSAQLHSYALMLENPSEKEKIISPVKTLGLFCFSPKQVIGHEKGSNSFQMNARWAEVKRNDKGFFSYVTLVLDLLHGEIKAIKNPKCTVCTFVDSHLAIEKKQSKFTAK